MIGKFKNSWSISEEAEVMTKESLETPRFKFIDTSRSRAMGADHTLYLFESMQEDGIRFNVVMKDKEIATLRNRDDFKTLLRVKCIKAYEEELNRLEEIARKKEFVLETGDII